jgi:histidinol-phosphate aminotransferase
MVRPPRRHSLMPSLNPVLENLPVYQPGRPIEEVARELGLRADAIIKLASNENPLGPSPRAIEAMSRVLSQLHLYPDGSAFYLKRRLAEKLGVEPRNLILGNGSNEIIEFVGHAVLAPGSEVVVSQYSFAVYPIVAHLFGARLVTVPARNHGHDLRAMLAAVTPATRVMFVANPNNPTGTLASREDVERLLAEIPPHVLLVMDEAYIEFLENPVDCLPMIRRGSHPNLLLMRTFSKILGLAGLRLGYGIGDPGLIAAMEKVRQPFNINAIAQAGALAALDDDEHMRRTRANNAAGLEFLASAFRRLALEYVPSSANFILVRVGDGQRVFAGLQLAGVITRPMAGYGLGEWLRISVGTPEQNGRCVSALESVLTTARTQ